MNQAANSVTLDQLRASRVLAIIRLPSAAPLVDIAEALLAGGITALEVTLTTPGALEGIESCRSRFGPDVVVAAGTVLGAGAAQQAVDAGAQILVSPITESEVIALARAEGVVALPGAMTPTEILGAARLGAEAVKVFPARSMGPSFIQDVMTPLPSLALVPTGGVDESNAASYLRAGAAAVGVGGKLVGRSRFGRDELRELTGRAARLMAATVVA